MSKYIMPYISVNRVKENLASNCGTCSTNDAVLVDMIAAASTWLDRSSGRALGGFLTQTYDELYHGTGDTTLYLTNCPVQNIARIATNQQPCLAVQNKDPDQGARATMQIIGTPQNPEGNFDTQFTSTGMTLTYIKSAVTTTNTLLWSAYPTVNELVVAINALGNHWFANQMGGFGTWSTTDLRATQGAYGCRITTAYVNIHWMDVPQYRVNEANGEVWNPWGFPRGQFSTRVIYTAGYKNFPDDLANALSELVGSIYMQIGLNPNLGSQELGGVLKWSMMGERGNFEKSLAGLSVVAKKTIGNYKRHSVGHFSSW